MNTSGVGFCPRLSLRLASSDSCCAKVCHESPYDSREVVDGIIAGV